MKKCIFALACLLSLSAHAEKYLTYADSPGTAVGFATQVVSYNPGSGASGNSALPKSAFGAPDGTLVSLGKSGNIVLQFGPNALKADGTSAADLYVYEGGWWDSFDVYISTDNVTYKKLTATTSAKASGGTGSWLGFNIDSQVDPLLSYPYVKIVDTSNSSSAVTGTDGADIDGVMMTSAVSPVGNYVMYDTDAADGSVYNLYQDADTGAVGVKVIAENKTVSYIPFSSDDTLEPIALSVQSDLNGDAMKDINVLVKRKADNAQLNITRARDGSLIGIVDNSVTK